MADGDDEREDSTAKRMLRYQAQQPHTSILDRPVPLEDIVNSITHDLAGVRDDVHKLQRQVTKMQDELSEQRGAKNVIGVIAAVVATTAIGIASWAVARGEAIALTTQRVEAIERHIASLDDGRAEQTEAMGDIAVELRALRVTLTSVEQRTERMELRLDRQPDRR